MPKHLLTAALLLLLTGVMAPSIAQEPPHVHFQRFEVAIWPEYDQPAALVMYRAWLSPDVQLPITVSLPVPSSVAAPSASAKRGPGTNLLVAPYTMEPGEQWNLVHLQTELPEVRLEFYIDLSTSQPERALLFEWPGGAEIDSAGYEVMQPIGAMNFTAAPSSAPPTVGQDGLTYQREDLGPIPEGGSFFVEFSYTKNTPNLTVSALQPVAPTPQQSMPPPAANLPAQPGTQPTKSSDNSVWFVVIPIVFAAGLAAGWILLSTKKEKSS